MLVVTMAAVLMLVTVALTGVAGLVRAHRSAQAAADLAALAGASAVVEGGDGCGVAGEVAGANGAELLHCSAAATHTEVEVGLDAPRGLARAVRLRARARAGPVP